METNPEIAELLHASESIVEYSSRKPRFLIGVLWMILGLWIVLESMFHAIPNPSLELVALIIAGLLFLYASVWVLIFSKREYVCVTNERVLYRKTNFVGKQGRIVSFPLQEITKARLCRITILFRQKQQTGHILLVIRNRRKYILPYLDNGMFIVEAIRDERSKIKEDE